MRRWLPADTSAVPTNLDRARFGLYTIALWVTLYFVVAAMGVRAGALDLRLPFERRLPVNQWTEIVYVSAYVAVPLMAVFVRSQRVLRQFMVQVWTAMAIAF